MPGDAEPTERPDGPADAGGRPDALRADASDFHELFRRAPVPIHSIGPDGLLVHVSDEWCAFTGYPREAALGRSFAEFLDPDSASLYLNRAVPELIGQAREDETRVVEYRLIKRDGTMADVVLTARPERDPVSGRFVRSLSVLSDVTARNRAAAALREAQKLEALGRLTAGVAHDFNNLLMAILANLQLLGNRLPPEDDRAAGLLSGALQGAERGAALTARLLAFSRQQSLEPGPVCLRRLVAGLDEFLRRAVGPAVEIAHELPADLWTLRADANQLELALVNLAVNAREAMPGGGRLRILARNATLAAEPPGRALADEAAVLAPGAYVVIEVADSGIGMDETTLARATEPFFTTKDAGKGTGLGLSMVHGFVGQSGGVLRLRSQPGAGTTAELWLPRSEADAAAAEQPHADPNAEPDAGASAETDARVPGPLRILVVDDDVLVRMGTVAMVEELGHAVAGEAATGAEALALLRGGAPVDLLLTDQAMPGMTGQQLAEAARALAPKLPVLLATGYAQPATAAGEVGNLRRLAKPYGLEELAAALSAFTVPTPASND